MNEQGAANLSLPPKWVMCMVCGDVLWAGPSAFAVEGKPLPRECKCRATRVLPKMDRGYVQWDKKMYEQAATEVAHKDAARKIMEEATAAADKAESRGATEDEIRAAYAMARENAEEKYLDPDVIAQAIKDAPREPEVEYCKPGEQLQVQVPVVIPTTVNDIYKQHWSDIEGGNHP